MNLIFYVALLLLAAPAWAGNYITDRVIAPTLLAPPPAEGSDAWKRDIAVIVSMQQSPPEQDLAMAAQEVHMKPELVTQVLGEGINRADYPALFSLLDKASQDGKAINDAAKEYWHTRRPYLASTDVKALVAPHANAAYPSGHTSGSLVWAEILAALFPDKRDALRDRAEQIAMHRVLAGMHYPSDLEGGRRLGLLTLGALWQSDAFRSDFIAAKAEIDAKAAK